MEAGGWALKEAVTKRKGSPLDALPPVQTSGFSLHRFR
jgi:hypothetical protein